MKFPLAKLTLSVALVSLAASFSVAADHVQKFHVPVFTNVGTGHYPISTPNKRAQQFFDQGMALFYSFEWNEAVRSFQEAARLDTQCSMCYWGVALALKSKHNAPVTAHDNADAKQALQKALLLSPKATPEERDMIRALTFRFPSPTIKSKKAIQTTHANNSDKKALISFAGALKNLAQKYPQDDNLKVLYADMLWWTIAEAEGRPLEDNPNVMAIDKILSEVLAHDKHNLGANQYYIHNAEFSSHPEKALTQAEHLSSLAPALPHLTHMPAHIYFLLGDYHHATAANLKAIELDKQYAKISREQGFSPAGSYLILHDYDFLRSAAVMEGRKDVALNAAKALTAEPFAKWLANDARLQWYLPVPYFVNARFGLWNQILKEPMPKAKYQYAQGMWYYAQGLALVHSNRVSDAMLSLNKLRTIVRKGSTESNLGRTGFNLLRIADEILTATIENSHGNMGSTITHLETALKIQDGMPAHQPPDWYFPLREILGNAYAAWGDPNNAAEMYEQDLKEFPNNGWALYGLMSSLKQLEQTQKLHYVEKEYKAAWKYADISKPIVLL